MKIKAMIHAAGDYVRERSLDLPKLQRNPDPLLHPLEKPREMMRALNAVKLERLFSKPFLGSLDGHMDGVYTMSKHYKELNVLLSGAADGELRLWDLSAKRSTWIKKGAHTMFVRGVSFVQNMPSHRVLSCSDDETIKLWDTSEKYANLKEPYCIQKYLGNHPFSDVDHHYSQSAFASSGEAIDIWRHERSIPVQRFEWGHDTLTTVKFNMTEVNILAACATDRSIVLYDLRLATPLSKVVLAMQSNALCWNPMEAFNFTVANEDHCCYTFDMRRLDQARNIFKDHVSAVLDLDYSPTGEEIVTGAYDRSMRIYHSRSGHSRDIYHTKRMQKVFSVKFSMDAKFVLSGSDDGNIRLWRAEAAERLGYKSTRQLESIKYAKAVKEKYIEIPEIKRIAKHRHVPKPIVSAQREKRAMLAARARKEENRRKHSKPGTVPYANKRKSQIVAIQK